MPAHHAAPCTTIKLAPANSCHKIDRSTAIGLALMPPSTGSPTPHTVVYAEASSCVTTGKPIIGKLASYNVAEPNQKRDGRRKAAGGNAPFTLHVHILDYLTICESFRNPSLNRSENSICW
jgi:hypothetical protein